MCRKSDTFFFGRKSDTFFFGRKSDTFFFKICRKSDTFIGTATDLSEQRRILRKRDIYLTKEINI